MDAVLNQAAEAAEEKWVDFGQRLTRAADSLGDLASRSTGPEAVRLSDKRAGVLAAYTVWAGVGFDRTRDSFGDLREGLEAVLRKAGSSPARQGIALAQSYL